MKLLEILVRELPKRGGWPDGADFAVQNYRDGGIKFGKNPIEIAISEKWNNELWQGEWHFSNQYDFICHEVSSDCREAIVLRGDYEAASAASKLEWNGEGEPPVGAEVECICNEFPNDGQEKLLGHILYSGEYTILKTYQTNNQHHVPVESVFKTKNWAIIPIRSEADKNRDEAIESIQSLIEYRNGCHAKALAKWLFEEIAAGKIPGIRVE